MFHRTNLSSEHYVGPEHDPFLKYCCNFLGHTFTGPEYMQGYAYLDEGERNFIAKASQSGMVSGIGIPVRTQNNPEYGGFNIGTGLGRAEFEAGPGQQVDRMRALCLLTQQRIEELGLLASDANSHDDLALQSLTSREREIFDLLVSGKKRQAIAKRLGISPLTVSTHVKSIYRKLGIHSQAEAMSRIGVAKMTGPVER